MKNSARWWMVAVATAGVLAASGCSQKQNEAAAPPAGGQTEAAAPANTEATEQEGGGSTVTPAGTVPAMWLQVDAEQQKLAAAIENGQLKDVHRFAFGIRDLIVPLADMAGAETPAVAQKLAALVEQVKASASKLDELGDAGNLSGTQVEYTKFDSVIKTMKTATGGH